MRPLTSTEIPRRDGGVKSEQVEVSLDPTAIASQLPQRTGASRGCEAVVTINKYSFSSYVRRFRIFGAAAAAGRNPGNALLILYVSRNREKGKY